MGMKTFDGRGFTLIEILVAIFIFSILFTVLFGSFRSLSTSTDTLANGTVQYEMGQHCMSRIVTDIEEMYVKIPPQYKQANLRDSTDPYRVEGSSEFVDGKTVSRFRFTSQAHFSFTNQKREGVAEIVYYVTTLEDGECVLRRADQLYPYETFEEKKSDPIICKNLQGFSVTFFNDDGEESDEWDSESSEFHYATPISIQIVLKIGDKDAPTVFSTRIYVPVHRENVA